MPVVTVCDAVNDLWFSCYIFMPVAEKKRGHESLIISCISACLDFKVPNSAFRPCAGPRGGSPAEPAAAFRSEVTESQRHICLLLLHAAAEREDGRRGRLWQWWDSGTSEEHWSWKLFMAASKHVGFLTLNSSSFWVSHLLILPCIVFLFVSQSYCNKVTVYCGTNMSSNLCLFQDTKPNLACQGFLAQRRLMWQSSVGEASQAARRTGRRVTHCSSTYRFEHNTSEHIHRVVLLSKLLC